MFLPTFQELEVGTMRSHLPINAVRRLCDKLGEVFGFKKDEDDDDDFSYLRSQANALSQFGFRTDIVIEDYSGAGSGRASMVGSGSGDGTRNRVSFVQFHLSEPLK